MNIQTEENFIGFGDKSYLSNNFIILKFDDGSFSSIPHGFFRDWLNNDIIDGGYGSFYIGRCSGFGVGSVVKVDSDRQALKVGRYVAGGWNLRFILNGQHDMECISTSMLSFSVPGLKNTSIPQYKDMIIKNDVWIGDEAMFLGGSTIENGCVIGARTVIPPNFQSEPYGVYVGAPAKLVKFRFSERVRELLVKLSWWEMPIEWIRQCNDKFLINLATIDELEAVDVLQEMIEHKNKFFKNDRKEFL